MQPVPADVAAALLRSRTVVTQVDAYTIEPDVGPRLVKENVAIQPGASVRVDRTAKVRRSLSGLKIADADGDLVPLSATGPLSPYGNELQLSTGLELPDGSRYLWPVGRVGIDDPNVTDPGQGAVTVGGSDRMALLSLLKLTQPYVVAPDQQYDQAIRALLFSVLPWLDIPEDAFDTIALPTPALTFAEGDDPGQRLSEMATGCGAEFYFDPSGVPQLHMVRTVDQSTTPDWTYERGTDATLASVTQTLSARGVASHVILIAQPTGQAPMRSDAYDDDPSSPTYWRGPFGDRPFRQTTAYTATQKANDAAAAAMIESVAGAREQVDFSALPVYAHEGGDIARVLDDRLGIDALYQLDAITLPLSGGTAKATTRQRRLVGAASLAMEAG